MMHGRGKSDSAIVAVKPANKANPPAMEVMSAAEPVERRAETKGNADWQSTHWTQRQDSVSQTLVRMRQLIAVGTRGRSRMRESCTYGSVRGALSNERPLYVADCLANLHLLSSEENGEPLASLWRVSLCGRLGPVFPSSAVQIGRYPGTRVSVDPAYKVARSGASRRRDELEG
jgi:hypothetical protein